MDGKLRCVVVLALLSVLGTGCSMWKSRGTKTVKIPEKTVSPPLKLKDEQNVDIQFALARTLEKDQNFDQAAALYRQILEQDPKHAGAMHRLAIVYDQQGLFDESAPLFANALKLRPGDADLFCDVGYSLYRQQKWQQAEMNYRQAIAVAPNHKRAHNHLGLVLAADNREEEALREFSKSGCTMAEARMNIALMHAAEGRWEAARHSYQLAQQSNPSSKEIAARIREVETALAQADGVATESSDAELAMQSAANQAPVPPDDVRRRSSAISMVGFEKKPDKVPDNVLTDDEDETPSHTKWWQRFTRDHHDSADN